MWRFFLYFHIKRSERKRLVLAFGLPVLVWFTYYTYSINRVGRIESVDYKGVLDSIAWVNHQSQIAFIDSLRQVQSFYADTTSLVIWSKLGMPQRDAQRLRKYFESGGAIRKESDLSRLNIGDSLWRSAIGDLILEREYTFPVLNRYSGKTESNWLFAISVNRATDSILENAGVSPWVQERWLKIIRSGRGMSNATEFRSWIKPDSTWFEKWRDELIYDDVSFVFRVEVNALDSNRMVNAQFLSPWEVVKWKRYGKRLGGYVNREQLYESGIDSSTVESLDMVEFQFGEIEKRDINNEDYSEMAKHPYIGWERARSADYYRTRVRPIQSVKELQGLEGWTERDVERVSQYFK